MFARKPISVLRLSDEAIARVDLGGRDYRVVTGHWSIARGNADSLAAALERGLRLGDHGAGKVLVTTDACWQGVITLDAEVVDAIADDELQQALMLEAENDSGIPAFESRIGFVEDTSILDVSAWSVVQLESSEIDSLKRVAKRCGATLLGVLADPVSTSTDDDPDLRGTSQSVPEPMVQRSPVAEDDPDHLHPDMLTIVREVLTNPKSSIPWIRLDGGRSQRTVQGIMTTGMIIATSAVCFALDSYCQRMLQQERSSLAEYKHWQTQTRDRSRSSEELDRQIQQLRQQRAAALSEREAKWVSRRRRAIASESARRRPVELLQALQRTQNEAHWVSNIRLNEDGTASVVGLALSSDIVVRLNRSLAEHLTDSTWQIQSMENRPLSDSKLVQFEIELCDSSGNQTSDDTVLTQPATSRSLVSAVQHGSMALVKWGP